MAIRIFNDIEGNGQNLDQFEVTVETNAGTPTASSPDGTIVVDTTNDELYFRSSSTWNQAGGGGGNPYLVVNSAGTLPTAAGSDAIALGEGASAAATRDIAIGAGATVFGTGPGIAIGYNANAGGTFESICIGENATAGGLGFGLVIGPNSATSAVRQISMGFTATCGSFEDCISIGTTSTALGTDSIAIGNTANATGTAGIAIGNNSDIAGGNSALAIGSNATCNGVPTDVGAVAIGVNATTNDDGCISIGNAATTTGNQSIAIGDGAVANALNAAQIGAGANNTASTLQFLGNTIADGTGVISPPFSGAQFNDVFTPSFSAPDSATTIIQWDSTPGFDTGGYILGGSTTTFTIPVDGWYHFTYQLSTTAVLTGGYFTMQIYRSNVSNIALINQGFNPTNPGAVTNVYQVSGMFKLDAGNEIVARIGNQTGTAITVSGISYFNIYQVGKV